jgi:hypothetical protein
MRWRMIALFNENKVRETEFDGDRKCNWSSLGIDLPLYGNILL